MTFRAILAGVAALLLPAAAFAQSQVVQFNNGDILAASSLNALQAAKADASNGTLTAPTINNGSAVGTNLSAAVAAPTGGTVRRPMADVLLDTINPVGFGAVGDGATDSGAAALSAIAAGQARNSTIVFPRTTAGYKLNGTPPGFTFVSNGKTYSYPGLMLGKVELGGNAFTGSMLGNPGAGAGTFNNQYTNPFNATSDIKWTFDPAALRNEGALTGYPQSIEAFSLECAPNRPNPLNSNPNRNWIACMYAAADTGKGGGAGTSIATGIANWVLNVDENSGTGLEFDIDSNGTGTKDGGIVRGLSIFGGGNDGNDTSNYIALDILRSSYSGKYQPYGAGVSIHSSVTSLELWKDIANEYGYAVQLLDSSAGNAQLFTIDKNGFLLAQGLTSQNSVSSLTFQSRARPFAALPACTSTYEGLEGAVTDSNAGTLGATITAGGGAYHVKAYCDGSKWTVEAL